jgi:predicted porin
MFLFNLRRESMNKKLVALAIAGALSAPMIAQAQTANVTLYGTVRGALVSTNFANGGGRANEEASYSSRFGIRASEGIGGGLTGFSHLEVGYDASQLGTNAAFGIRESWVGLSGGFGEVKLGAGLNVYDDVMGMNHNSLVAGYNNINAQWFGNGFSNYNSCVGTAWDARYANSVRYTSPNLGPVKVSTQAAILNEGASGKKCSAWDTALFAGFGPFQAGLAFSHHNNFAAALSATGARVLDHDADNIIATVKGSFGIVDANVAIEQAKYNSNHNSSSAKYKAFIFGIGANFGPTKVGFDYSARDNGIGVGGTAFSPTVVANTLGGGKLATLYVNHSLSKRTLGYVWLSSNKPETGNKSTQVAVALRHNF